MWGISLRFALTGARRGASCCLIMSLTMSNILKRSETNRSPGASTPQSPKCHFLWLHTSDHSTKRDPSGSSVWCCCQYQAPTRHSAENTKQCEFKSSVSFFYFYKVSFWSIVPLLLAEKKSAPPNRR
ncbi:hypothetical protein CEXT_600181 [Caerostris extrusa]|uniref:Secreted protein n=1 Tax=Caerostris extrusa TaxID=172846 RepID=A0AAV4Q4G0_CAEEX|nr:hypothetical protein CEXT_600181 [Caerostris extrusa]